MEKNELMWTLVDTGPGVVLLRVLNPTDQSRMLYKNTVLATCESDEQISMSSAGESACGELLTILKERTSAKQDHDAVPEHLVDLFERSRKYIWTQDNEQNLLISYRNFLMCLLLLLLILAEQSWFDMK